jgi:hypothetical protein
MSKKAKAILLNFKITFLLIFLLFSISKAAASTPYTIAGSYPLLDMTSGTYDTLALYDLTSPFFQTFGSYVDSLWLGTVIIFHHEYFGHGFRAREFELDGYPIVTPFIGFYVVTDPIPDADANLLITLGGIESNLHAYRLLRERYLMTESQNYIRGASFHRMNAYFYYLIFSAFFGDPYSHAEQIDDKYDTNGKATQITRDYIGVLWMTLDPMTLASLPIIGNNMKPGSYLYFGGVKFMYGTNYFMTPYGAEYDLDLCFLIGKSYHQFTGRYGDGGKYILGGFDITQGNIQSDYSNGMEYAYGGAGWRTRRIVGLFDTLFLGTEINGWYLPEENDGFEENRKKPGYSYALQIETFFNRSISFEVEGGYKTQGYLPGRYFKEEYFAFFGINGNL